jgi:hypothetical protein
MNTDVIILGRGPSAYSTELPADADVMAVSSGVFAVPEGRHVDHFVSLDVPKFFIAPLMGVYDIAWQNDKRARVWPFWSDPGVTKHVAAGRNRRGFVRMIPIDLFDRIPERLHKWREPMKDALLECHHEIGFQPGWADYPNVRGWLVAMTSGSVYEAGTKPGPLPDELPSFVSPAEPLKLNGVRNSLIFAVQIAVQLGYKRLLFAGCDLNEPGYEVVTATLRDWMPIAAEHGVEWVNISPESALSEFMGGEVLCDA